jgi:F-type H+-transporting ATPase subunit delta
MTLSAVAARYANAFADVVTKSSSALRAQDALSELRSFESVLKSSADLHEVLMTPAVPIGRKRAVLGRVADLLKSTRITRNFLFVLVDHRRIALLSEIIAAFDQAVDERLGFARADVQSARELTGPQRAALTAQLQRLTGKHIRPRYAVDESLIGGVVARIGSTVYDGSVRGQLETLERRLGAEA